MSYKIFNDGIGNKGISASDCRTDVNAPSYLVDITKGGYAADWKAIAPDVTSKSPFFKKFGRGAGQFNIDKFLSPETDSGDRSYRDKKLPKPTGKDKETLVKLLSLYTDRALSMSLSSNPTIKGEGLQQLTKLAGLAYHCGVLTEVRTQINKEIDRTPAGDEKNRLLANSIFFTDRK